MKAPFKKVLKNGLTVILQESRTAPVVSMNLCCKVGSRYEDPREAGMCHLIEHMIFKGTPTYPVGEIARRIEASGGDINAYTSFDETVFYVSMSSRYQEDAFRILIDAALHPLFDQEELTREKEVVVEEIARSEDSPAHQASEDLFQKAFSVHPYGLPIAGTRKSVRTISRTQLKSFYKKWYVGPNLIFVMVGDFDQDELFLTIRPYLEKFSSKSSPQKEIPQEPIQKRTRAVTRSMNIHGEYLAMGFHARELTHQDVPALDVLAHVLGGSESSRLDHAVRDKEELVSSIQASCFSPQEPCLFLIDAQLSSNNPKATVRAVMKEIDQLQLSQVTEAEISRAKANIVSARIYEKETVEGLCRKLGFFEIVAGDYAYEKKYYQKIQAVSKHDVQAVAKRYLQRQNLTLALCHPNKKKFSLSSQELLSCIRATPIKPQIMKRSTKDVHVCRLSNGVKLLIKQNNTVPLISMRAACLGGVRLETPRTNGLAHMLSETITKGTRCLSASEIAAEIDAISGSLSGFSGRNLIGLQGIFLSEKLEDGTRLFGEVLTQATFESDEVKKEKKRTLAAIRDEDDLPGRLVFKIFLEKLFTKHPYKFPLIGNQRSISSLKADHLKAYHHRCLDPKNLVVSVVGDAEPELMKDLLGERLASIAPRKGKSPRILPQSAPKKMVETIIQRSGIHQTHIVIGFLGSTFKSKDNYALDVLNAVLSGQGGRLFLELRDKQGLAYSVNSSNYEGIEPGFIAVYMGTDPHKRDIALSGMKKELELLTKKPISRAELSRAQRYLIGSFDLDLQRNQSVAALMAYDEVYGLGYHHYKDYANNIRKVSIQDVHRVAKKYLCLDRSVTSIVQP
jgi:zinc protease